jgi:2,3-bisphosphoglycerate-dependent phosphoglycerate mutase
MNPKLYIVTHCESCFNAEHIFTGRLNSPLTANGIHHAQEIAEELKDELIDVAIHTSLDRTLETLSYITKYHPHCRVESDDRMIERDYGDLSGQSKDQYAKDHPDLYPIYHRSYDVAPPNGESIQDVEKRVLPFLKELIARMKREQINVLLVCHGNSIRPMIRYFEHLTSEQMMQLEHMRHHVYRYHIDI